ncbi:hypothetical protein Droror1_Dr00016540 [Drosera rotundifolia]
MSHQMQHPYISSISQMPAKRRRGRPRKNDEPLVHYSHQTPPMVLSSIAVSPATPVLPTTPVPLSYVDKGKEPIEVDQGVDGNNVCDEMVGRAVTGVVESAFDAGYLIAVKVGDTYMRGVIFQPDKIIPITKENDVAPNVKFYTQTQLSTDDNQNVQDRVVALETDPSQPSAQGNIEELNEDLTVEAQDGGPAHLDKQNRGVDLDESLIGKEGGEFSPVGGQNKSLDADNEVSMVHIDQHKETLKDSDSSAGNGGTHEGSECKASGVTRGEVNEKVPCSRTEEAMEIVDDLLAKATNVDESTNKGSVSLEGNVDSFIEGMTGEVNTHKETI